MEENENKFELKNDKKVYLYNFNYSYFSSNNFV